jgi:2,3-bisphosphoglycerate-independent phosphoglycerate mutase
MKYILLIGDGMGMLLSRALGGRTPLEAAATPTMDRLARQAEMLLVRTVPEGYPPGAISPTCPCSATNRKRCYTGRAPLEAASMGVDIGAEETAFRCNLVHVERPGSGA